MVIQLGFKAEAMPMKTRGWPWSERWFVGLKRWLTSSHFKSVSVCLFFLKKWMLWIEAFVPFLELKVDAAGCTCPINRRWELDRGRNSVANCPRIDLRRIATADDLKAGLAQRMEGPAAVALSLAHHYDHLSVVRRKGATLVSASAPEAHHWELFPWQTGR